MEQEEDEDYEEEQRRADMRDVRNSRSIKFETPIVDDSRSSRSVPFPMASQQQQQQQQAHSAAQPSAAANAAMQSFDWNAGAMAQLQVRGYFLVFVPTIREIRDFYREM
eukprot:SAG31_NODE_5501_length_2499_cov_1.627083_2_plen_109_part_00